MLDIGRTIKRLVTEGKIPQPKRDIIFWWVDEISSEYQYFRDYPDEARALFIDMRTKGARNK